MMGQSMILMHTVSPMGDDNVRLHAADHIADLQPNLLIVWQLSVTIIKNNGFTAQHISETLCLFDFLLAVLLHILPGRHASFTWS